MIFKNVKVYTNEFRFKIKDVYVNDGVFSDKPSGEEIDCSGLMMWPGLIDIHTHGAVGNDHMDNGVDIEKEIAGFMAKKGVTTYIPTIMTNTREALVASCKNIKEANEKGTGGAKIGGIHMEGPYFSMKYKGAQSEEYIRDPDIDEFNEINEASGGLLRMVSVAPERNGAVEFIKQASEKCKIAIGHTDSDYETAIAAINAGASVLTHTFNGMRGLHHREPNAIGAAVTSENVMCECICDGHHIHPAMVKLLFSAVGSDRFVIISDSLRSAGLADGEYTMADGRRIFVKDALARLEDGTIAGSSANMFDNVVNTVKFGISLKDAIKCASYNPAKAVGIENIAGSIDIGRAADFLLVDESLDLKSVYINGKSI